MIGPAPPGARSGRRLGPRLLACLLPASAVEAPSSAESLFCVNGRQLPHLLLLGAQKCGTTSFAYQLREEYSVSPALTSHKEVHYFDNGGASLEGYAEQFPPCGPDTLTFDGTPNYVAYPDSIASNLRAIKAAYGPARLNRTTFAMLLCDPLQRAQSFIYHLGDGGFREAAASALDDVAFRGGLYGAQIDAIVAELGQLAVIPSVVYYADARAAISALLDLVARRSGRTLPPSDPGQWREEAAQRNTASKHAAKREEKEDHPPVEDDVDASDTPRLAAFFRASNEHTYSLTAGADPRISLLPPRDTWPSEAPAHWLETSPVLARFIRPATPAPAPRSPPPAAPPPRRNATSVWRRAPPPSAPLLRRPARAALANSSGDAP